MKLFDDETKSKLVHTPQLKNLRLHNPHATSTSQTGTPTCSPAVSRTSSQVSSPATPSVSTTVLQRTETTLVEATTSSPVVPFHLPALGTPETGDLALQVTLLKSQVEQLLLQVAEISELKAQLGKARKDISCLMEYLQRLHQSPPPSSE